MAEIKPAQHFKNPQEMREHTRLEDQEALYRERGIKLTAEQQATINKRKAILSGQAGKVSYAKDTESYHKVREVVAGVTTKPPTM